MSAQHEGPSVSRPSVSRPSVSGPRARRPRESGIAPRPAPDPASVFVAALAHELAGPLQQIVLHADVLQRLGSMEPCDGARVVATARAIGRVAERTGVLLRALRAVVGDEEPGPARAFALAPVVEQALELTHGRARAAGVVIAGRCPPAIEVLGHREELVHALRNLVENAIDAAAEGRRWAHVRVEASRDVASIRVVDGGPGLSTEQLESLFVPFATSKRGAGGSGLGLVVARTLVERMGGWLTLRRGEARTTFEIGLPAV